MENNISSVNLEYIKQLNSNLNIDIEQQLLRGLKLFDLADDLVDAGLNSSNKPAKLSFLTLEAWNHMVQAANKDNITLKICSAYRDYDYQAMLIEAKLKKNISNISIDEIIKTLAPPGFSEHHTGRAIDIITNNVTTLDENFEFTNAFRWLSKNADKYGFVMSYPRDNKYKYIYEPWHWCYRA